jgi:uncharacterized protein (TIGR02271 family)
MMREDDSAIVVPLLAEEISVAKQQVITGRVHISRVTREKEELVDEPLINEHVKIERVPVGKVVDHAPAVREEGDTLIIPVVEEVLVVERRLLLKEEVRVRRVRDEERHQERVNVRRQELTVTRHPAKEEAAANPAAGVEKQIPRKE